MSIDMNQSPNLTTLFQILMDIMNTAKMSRGDCTHSGCTHSRMEINL